MKTRKELAEILKAGIEDGDSDTIWFVVGELEKGEGEHIEIIKARKASYIKALDDAYNNIPLEEDEFYESDEYYHSAIEVLNHLLKELEGK